MKKLEFSFICVELNVFLFQDYVGELSLVRILFVLSLTQLEIAVLLHLLKSVLRLTGFCNQSTFNVIFTKQKSFINSKCCWKTCHRVEMRRGQRKSRGTSLGAPIQFTKEIHFNIYSFFFLFFIQHFFVFSFLLYFLQFRSINILCLHCRILWCIY